MAFPRKLRATKTTAIASVAVLVVAAAAFAYWTAQGSGTGTADTATGGSALTAVQTSSITGIAPGVAAKPISGNFNNPNSAPTYVNTVTVSIASVTKAGGAPAGTCDATDYTLSNAAMTVNASIPAGNAQGAFTGATIAFNNKVTNQDACKGATVNLSYAIS